MSPTATVAVIPNNPKFSRSGSGRNAPLSDVVAGRVSWRNGVFCGCIVVRVGRSGVMRGFRRRDAARRRWWGGMVYGDLIYSSGLVICVFDNLGDRDKC